jgi:uncharacterized membrane protein YgdD (TMEM256/DUF423 family)
LVNLAFYICMNKQIIITAALFGAVAVIAGAFGAHALKASLSAASWKFGKLLYSTSFTTYLRCCFYQPLPVLKNGLISTYYLFTFGIILFSGSLYLLACRDLIGMPGLAALGPVTHWRFAVYHRMDIFSFRCFQKQITLMLEFAEVCSYNRKTLFVEVILPLAISRNYTYRVPLRLIMPCYWQKGSGAVW